MLLQCRLEKSDFEPAVPLPVGALCFPGKHFFSIIIIFFSGLSQAVGSARKL